MRPRRLSPTTKKLLSVAIFGVLCIGTALFFRGGFVRGSAALFSPLWKGSDATASILFSVPYYFTSRSGLIEENKTLREDVLHAQTSVLDRNQLYEENLALKERLGREAQPNAALAAVVLRPPEVPYDTLLIDIGEDSDIAVGDKVAAQGTLLIGVISEVYAHTSRVSLFSSPQNKYNGFLRGTIPVEVVGQGGGSLVMEVPYDAKVVVGDTVTLPGIAANVASIVEYVEPGQGDSAVTAYLHMPVSAQGLRFVDVWRSGK